MPETKVAFIDPAAALGALTPKPAQVKLAADLADHLGPTPPHEEPVAAEPVKATLGAGLNPGSPPILGTVHYTNVLDQIWPKFDEPEERTAARLSALLDQVADEAYRVYQLGQDMWANMPWYKVPELQEAQYNKELQAYLHRINDYRDTLRSLEPDSTDTESVYIGLVQRRQGAGPVPDCIMHLYFADQLGILADHAQVMGEGFVGRVVDSLAAIDAAIKDTVTDAINSVDEAKAEAKANWNDFWTRLSRASKIASGVLIGTVVTVAGIVIYRAASRPQPRQLPEPQEPSA